MVTHERIRTLIDRFDRKAETACSSYQDTGIARYDTARRNAEELADALRMALSAEPDHAACISMRCSIAQWAADARSLSSLGEAERVAGMDTILGEIIAFATLFGLTRAE